MKRFLKDKLVQTSSSSQMGPNDRPPMVYECGPGQTLSAMLGKINGKAASMCQFIPV